MAKTEREKFLLEEIDRLQEVRIQLLDKLRELVPSLYVDFVPDKYTVWTNVGRDKILIKIEKNFDKVEFDVAWAKLGTYIRKNLNG